MSLTILNDLHLGAKRSGGTTFQSALALREYLLQQYTLLLDDIRGDLLINGDFLDSFSIDLGDLLKVYDITCDWLHERKCDLYLAQGNHDIEKDSTKTSSFDLLSGLLERRFSGQVIVIDGPYAIPKHNAYVIPHLINQDAFNAALADVPKCDYLFLHCNYDNPFAVHSDHSLNLSVDQAKALPVKNIIFGHEHQQKEALKGKVCIVGNQFPSSVADCLGNDHKYYATIPLPDLALVRCWSAEDSFAEQDWQNLQDGPQFIRVTGQATAQQAADVVSAISRFRASSDAFVITNAVSIAGMDDQAMIDCSLEQIRAFSVLEALLEILEPAEQVIVKGLLEKRNA